ncbi:MAG: hypothetical protein ACK4VW_06875 [Anaerolineales bacterium]
MSSAIWVLVIIVTLIGVAIGRYWLRINRATIALVGEQRADDLFHLMTLLPKGRFTAEGVECAKKRSLRSSVRCAEFLQWNHLMRPVAARGVGFCRAPQFGLE